MKNKREAINYLFFGVLATIVNVVFYQLFGWLLGEELYLFNNIFSWVITVAFAYITNKLWVFESKSWKFAIIKRELVGFIIARLFSLLLEEAGLFLLIDIIGLDKFQMVLFGFYATGSLIAKIIMQVIVVLTNYIFSKFLIFKTN